MSFKTQISQKIVSIVFSVLVICFGIGFYVFAWTGPTESPPGGNVAVPLNVGPTGQTKLGGLIFNTSVTPAEYGLLVAQGKVGIGTMSPQADLEVNNTLRLSPTDSPSYAVEGALYYDNSDNTIMYHDGSDWQPILAGASSGSTPRGSAIAITAESPGVMNHGAAASYCYNLSATASAAMDGDITTIYTDWRLPTTEELAVFMYTIYDFDYVWTASIYQAATNGYNAWIKMSLVGGWRMENINQISARCVR